MANSLRDNKLAEIFSPEIIEALVAALLDNKATSAHASAVNKPYNDEIMRLTWELNGAIRATLSNEEISKIKMDIEDNNKKVKRISSTVDTRRAQLAKIFGVHGTRYCADLIMQLEMGRQIHSSIYNSLGDAGRLCEDISKKVQIEKARNERKEVIRSELLS